MQAVVKGRVSASESWCECYLSLKNPPSLAGIPYTHWFLPAAP